MAKKKQEGGTKAQPINKVPAVLTRFDKAYKALQGAGYDIKVTPTYNMQIIRKENESN